MAAQSFEHHAGNPALCEGPLEAVIEHLLDGPAPKGLLFRLRLQLMQYDQGDRQRPELVQRELRRITDNREFCSGEMAASSLGEVQLKEVEAPAAYALHRKAHYLGSSRRGLVHFGLVEDRSERILALFSFSAFDLEHLAGGLPAGISPTEVLVLSRMVPLGGSPRNTLSMGLGRCFDCMRESRPETRLLLTYLDPNLGFSGAVYRATNWVVLFRERKRRYLFLDGRYVTDRALIRDYGTAHVGKLKAVLGSRLNMSRGDLKPLIIYGYFLYRTDRRKANAARVGDILPNPDLVGT